MFGFGDASGRGFGMSVWTGPDDPLFLDIGLWEPEVSARGSNYRELLNHVLRVEQLWKDGKLGDGVELFLFTDNYVAERAFHNGNTRSKTLFELVFRLRKLEMEGSLFLHIIWIAGTRMIAQGTDGLS